MPRSCIICESEASSFIREKAREGRQPRSIITSVNRRFDININYAQYRYHTLKHDLKGGTTTMLKRTVDRKLDEAEDNLLKSRKMVRDLHDFLSKVIGVQEDITPERLSSLSVVDKIKVAEAGIKLLDKLKNTEMRQQKLDIDRNPALIDLNRFIARSSSKATRKEDI